MDTSSKERKKKMIITVILGILIIYAALYILLFNYLVPNQKKNDQDQNDILSATDQEVLVSMIPYIHNVMDDAGSTGVYDVELRNTNNLSDIVLFNMAYNVLAKDEGNFLVGNDERFVQFQNKYCKDENSKCFILYRSSLESVLKRNYNKESYEWQTFQIGANANNECLYENGEFYCHVLTTPEEDTIKKAGVVALAKKDENNVYIYEKVLFLDGYSETKNDNGYLIHANNIFKYYRSDNYAFNEAIDIESPDGKYESELIKKYDNQVQIFKSTFKKESNGSYTWVSTEPASAIGD